MKRLKKVAILISHIPNPRILKRIKALENDFKITLIYWDRGQLIKESFEINQIHTVFKIYIRSPLGEPIRRIIPLIKYMIKAIKVLRCDKPDIIHAGNLDMLFISALYKMVFDKKIHIVYEVGDLPKYAFVKKTRSLKSILAKLMQYIEKKLTSKISKIILTSPYFWEEYFSKFIDEDKYMFIPNAPSRKIFNRYQKRKHNNFTIGFIGSVRYVEQLKMLIDSVDELGNDFKVFIAGGGPGYEDIVEYSQGKNFVEIYGPYNYEKEIVNLYERVDCVYSVYDTKLKNVKIALPNRLYEAICCEIPIIAAKGTILGKFIEKEEIGLTVNDTNKGELKKVLLQLKESSELIKFFQNNCKKIKANYYDENNSANLLYEYKMLLK